MNSISPVPNTKVKGHSKSKNMHETFKIYDKSIPVSPGKSLSLNTKTL